MSPVTSLLFFLAAVSFASLLPAPLTLHTYFLFTGLRANTNWNFLDEITLSFMFSCHLFIAVRKTDSRASLKCWSVFTLNPKRYKNHQMIPHFSLPKKKGMIYNSRNYFHINTIVYIVSVNFWILQQNT